MDDDLRNSVDMHPDAFLQLSCMKEILKSVPVQRNSLRPKQLYQLLLRLEALVPNRRSNGPGLDDRNKHPGWRYFNAQRIGNRP